MDSLPLPILAQICSYVAQQDLASMAATSRFLHPIASEALYKKVSVVLGAQRPLLKEDEGIKRDVSSGGNGSFVFSSSGCASLLRTLDERLKADLVEDFCFVSCDNGMEDVQRRFRDVLTGSTRLRAFHMEPALPETVGGDLTHRTVRSMDSLEKAMSECCCNVSVDLEESAEAKKAVTLPISHTLCHLRCNSESSQGLQVLDSLGEPEDRLQLDTLSISHLHQDGNDPLHFSSVAAAIDIPHLSKLVLNVDCHELNCSCYSVFFDRFASFVAENGGLPNLTAIEIEAFPQEDWLRPVEMLERVLEPVSNFLRQLTGLTALKLDLQTPSLKMTGDSENSISDANKINRRLVDAFFLSMFKTPDFGHRIKKLELPDFLASFAYYKPDFFGSMLHTCSCHGCESIIKQLSEGVIADIIKEDPEEVDENEAFYLVMYAILRKLQNEQLIPLKDKSTYSQALLKSDNSDWLTENFGTCTVSESALKTYVLHQLRSVESYFSGIFENMTSLNLHGVYFEKEDSMRSVFQNENYFSE
ncbi:hypothetical protein FT663_01319 [Candidozyma haemuli var. vulneris]|uniref:F-box domain-containing protein n=1 Tax=Candidozyma haemuli TaxID=45357 RepID=A0A2V1AY85_9ASCO|nr:hypothetical protein CXQ85_002473 [[Candida] haemuloni]KAF3993908.1 hypothetical protein FT662_00356 [[Candida] haemuloni var. vulneris]KAF3994519.1 hypothetical protein FT663_01319 [[Candida] haemuloni var. vulneris]PVH22754.1 hypothetical protein CXQ85_002473 [[Candida] haemuloni]